MFEITIPSYVVSTSQAQKPIAGGMSQWWQNLFGGGRRNEMGAGACPWY
jgi:hypothetical protein